MTWYQLTLMWFGAYVLVGVVCALAIVREEIRNIFKLREDDSEFNELCSKLLIVISTWPIICPMLLVFDISNKARKRFETRVNKLTSDRVGLVCFLAEIEAISHDKATYYNKSISASAELKKQSRRDKWYSL